MDEIGEILKNEIKKEAGFWGRVFIMLGGVMAVSLVVKAFLA